MGRQSRLKVERSFGYGHLGCCADADGAATPRTVGERLHSRPPTANDFRAGTAGRHRANTRWMVCGLTDIYDKGVYWNRL